MFARSEHADVFGAPCWIKEDEMSTLQAKISSAALLIFLALMAFGCGEETAGEALSFDTEALGVTESGTPDQAFTNSKGWRITLDSAVLAVGPVYYYSSEAQASLFDRLFSIKSAYACPAHAQYDKGTVLGEIRQQVVVDLLAESPTTTGVSQGEKGHCQMFELHFHPPGEIPAASDDAAFEPLDGYSFAISGVAEKDGVDVSFSGHLTIPDEGTMRIVESIPADVILDGRSGQAVVKIHVDRQLANLDFASITDESGACLEEAEDGACLIGEDSQAHLAWLYGVRSRECYSLEWRE